MDRSILQCYSVREGTPDGKNVRLVTDNFGGAVVFVELMAAIYEQATKTIPTGAVYGQFDLPVIMARCVIRHGTNLDDLVELTAPNFQTGYR